ncbi:MAG: glycosyltransferase family 2 protein [Coriobacteriales bacterium]|jgi:GT2 family glycosyltransferase|nr:glycosyltransferase family 2 protein [Coriobacteriales bacterium]
MTELNQKPAHPVSVRNLVRVVRSVRDFGLKSTARRVFNRLRPRKPAIFDSGFILSDEVFERQRSRIFAAEHLFSILVPLYNTSPEFLKMMIDSVQNQSYQHWELCLADASDENHSAVADCCRSYAELDERIKYRKLAGNEGIAANTNCCLQMASGDYLALLDHDDALHPSALYLVAEAIEEQGADMLYSDEIIFSDKPENGFSPHFKPAFSPDTLRSYNYICHLLVFSRDLQQKVGTFRSVCDGSQDYDMALRLSEKARRIVHIPLILYYWRKHDDSFSQNSQQLLRCAGSAKRALDDHLQRVGLVGSVTNASLPTVYRIQYQIANSPLISIIILNKDHIDDLELCLESIVTRSNYNNYELVIVENNSTENETFMFYDTIPQRIREWFAAAGRSGAEPCARIIKYQGSFNFSAINNFAARQAEGEMLLFLNNDTSVISPDWMQEMLMFAQRPEVAAVGARLLFPDDTIQHGGVIIGIGGLAGHAHKGFKRDSPGYVCRLQLVQNISAVTGACLMLRKQVFWQIGGFDEDFVVAFNDVDLCMRLRAAGYLNVFTPFAELYHHESKTRGYEDTPEKNKRFRGESVLFRKRWALELDAGDPYYSPHMSLEREDFSLRLHDIEADTTPQQFHPRFSDATKGEPAAHDSGIGVTT